MTNALIVRYNFQDPSPANSNDLADLLKSSYGGGLNFVADGTVFINTTDTAEMVFDMLSPYFTYDDKLFVGELNSFESLHHITRVSPTIHRIAI